MSHTGPLRANTPVCSQIPPIEGSCVELLCCRGLTVKTNNLLRSLNKYHQSEHNALNKTNHMSRSKYLCKMYYNLPVYSYILTVKKNKKKDPTDFFLSFLPTTPCTDHLFFLGEISTKETRVISQNFAFKVMT